MNRSRDGSWLMLNMQRRDRELEGIGVACIETGADGGAGNAAAQPRIRDITGSE